MGTIKNTGLKIQDLSSKIIYPMQVTIKCDSTT